MSGITRYRAVMPPSRIDPCKRHDPVDPGAPGGEEGHATDVDTSVADERHENVLRLNTPLLEWLVCRERRKRAESAPTKRPVNYALACQSVGKSWGVAQPSLRAGMSLSPELAPLRALEAEFRHLTQNQLNELARYLKTHGRGLRTLRLMLMVEDKLKFKPLWDALKSMSGLKHLDLDIGHSSLVDDGSALLTVSRVLRYLPGLRRLSLDIASNDIPGDALETAFREVAKATQLQALTVDVSWSRETDEPTMGRAFATLKSLTSLRELTICAQFRQLRDDGDETFQYQDVINALVEVLPHTKALETLRLDVSDSEFNDDQAVTLAQAWGEVPWLSNIELAVNNTRCSNRAIEAFCAIAVDRNSEQAPLKGVTIHARNCEQLESKEAKKMAGAHRKDMAARKLPVTFYLS